MDPSNASTYLEMVKIIAAAMITCTFIWCMFKD